MLNRLLNDQSMLIDKKRKEKFQKKLFFIFAFFLFFSTFLDNFIKYFFLNNKLPIKVDDTYITRIINLNLLKNDFGIYLFIMVILFILYCLLPNYKFNLKIRKTIFLLFVVLNITITSIFITMFIRCKVNDSNWNIYIDKVQSFYTLSRKYHRTCKVTLQNIANYNNRAFSAPIEECSAYFKTQDYIYVIKDDKNRDVYFFSTQHYRYAGEKTLNAFEDVDFTNQTEYSNKNYYLKKLIFNFILTLVSAFLINKSKINI